MKNLTGYLKRILSVSSFLILFQIFTTPIQAQTGFNITSEFIHTVDTDTVNTELIISLDSEIDRVLTLYTATLPLKDIEVKCTDITNGETLECDTYERTDVTDVQIDTENIVVRENSPLKLKLTYSTPLPETYTFSSYVKDAETSKVTVQYPKEKGEPFWASDTIQSLKISGDQYVATFTNPQTLNTSILFGEVVNYKFQISRVLNNTLTEDNETFEILVPSDSTNQLTVFEEIEPLPEIAIRDENGNYVFKYTVEPSETLDISISGYIQKRKADSNAEEEISSSLTETFGYWEIDEKEIQNLVYYINKTNKLDLPADFTGTEDLKEGQKITTLIKYTNQYIKERLEYKTDSELGINSGIRLGANSISEKPYDLTQEDYADFSIAIFREIGIPARMVVGYISNVSGYTSDGFYHTWVEVFDEEEQEWIIIDPFLEDYTENNLFGSEYLDHISILRREDSPTSPKLSFYQPSDFKISSSQDTDVTPSLSAEISLDFEPNNWLNKYLKGSISYSSKGNIVISNYEILKSNINAEEYLDYVNNTNSEIILPKQNGEILINLPSDIEELSPFVSLSLSNPNGISEEYLLNDQIEIKSNSFISILSKLISITIFAALTYLIYFLLNKYVIKTK